jgi:hypothetical protein
VAVVKSLPGVFNGGEGAAVASLGDLGLFRREFYECLSARADVLFELTDALLCTEGPVRSLVGLSLAPEHRRGHDALYDAVNHGRIELARLRVSLAALAVASRREWAAGVGGRGFPVASPRTRIPVRSARSAIPMVVARTSI